MCRLNYLERAREPEQFALENKWDLWKIETLAKHVGCTFNDKWIQYNCDMWKEVLEGETIFRGKDNQDLIDRKIIVSEGKGKFALKKRKEMEIQLMEYKKTIKYEIRMFTDINQVNFDEDGSFYMINDTNFWNENIFRVMKSTEKAYVLFPSLYSLEIILKILNLFKEVIFIDIWNNYYYDPWFLHFSGNPSFKHSNDKDYRGYVMHVTEFKFFINRYESSLVIVLDDYDQVSHIVKECYTLKDFLNQKTLAYNAVVYAGSIYPYLEDFASIWGHVIGDIFFFTSLSEKQFFTNRNKKNLKPKFKSFIFYQP